MELAQIRLSSQMAMIHLDIQQPQQIIEQPQAELDLQQPSAEVTIQRTPGRLTIDQTKAREDVDLKHISKRIREFAELGYQDWLEGMGRVAQEGTELMKIENGRNPLLEQAKRHSERHDKQLSIGWIPSPNGVSIQFVPTEIKIDVKPNKVINNSRPQKSIHQYTPGKVAVSMQQYQSLKIDFANLKYKGINYEIEI